MALYEAREKIAQLETALKRLDFVKKHLNRNASDIKKEIHSCVSRNLECLRGREVALLDQVDEVLGIKEEALHQQQAHLNQALGVLKTGLTMMKDDATSEKQLRDTLQKLNRMDLSPGETPHIAFRADHISLKESILKYGRVDSNGLSFAAFEDPEIPSACLPRHLEDYEDVDHHVFNKPVQAINAGNASIIVTIPKISNRMEDWLQKRTTEPSVGCPVLPLSKQTLLTPQPATINCKREPAKSGASTPSDACSLNNWLSIIKNHSDLEEEHDFEIVDNSSSKEGEVFNPGYKSSTDFFSHIKKDMKLWITSTSNGSEDFKEVKERNFFRHIPREGELWLSKASQQLSSLEETADTDFFKHVSKQPSTWLRSRAHVKHQTTRSVSKDKVEEEAQRKIDLKKWLAIAPKNDVTMDDKEDMKHQDKQRPQRNCPTGCRSLNEFQLEEVCRANELCSSASECVSQPNCAVFYQNYSAAKNTINPQSAFKPLNLSTDQWRISDKGMVEDSIAGKTKTASDNPDSGFFSLKVPTNAFKPNKEETNQWLHESHMDLEEPFIQISMPCLTPSCPKSSLSDWLMPPASNKEREHEMEKELSEGWSLCSSPSTANSDQYTKDVEVAIDYMNKWIL